MINALYRNSPNLVTILGVLPVFLLLDERFFIYLIPLILYNNFMDDLDGILAAKLNLRSNFGAALDNLCDGVAHSIFVMTIGFHLGNWGIIFGLVATTSILLRIVSRMTTTTGTGKGSPTNELIRHLCLLWILSEQFNFSPLPWMISLCAFHSVSMLATFPMPHMIRSRTKSAVGVLMVTLILTLAWLFPMTAPAIAGGFLVTYLFSFFTGVLRNPGAEKPSMRSSG